MSIVGHVESLWRYPVKSMRGEELDTSYMGFSGVYGDRLYAFRTSVAPEGFPYVTDREQEQMLLYQPRSPAGAKGAHSLGRGRPHVFLRSLRSPRRHDRLHPFTIAERSERYVQSRRVGGTEGPAAAQIALSPGGTPASFSGPAQGLPRGAQGLMGNPSVSSRTPCD